MLKTRPKVIAVLRSAAILAASCALSCSRRDLGDDEARRLVEATFVDALGSQCQFWMPRPIGPKHFIEDEQNAPCADDLVKAGLIVKGECRKMSAQYCTERAVDTRTSSRFDDLGIHFPCGDLRFVRISSIEREPQDTVIVRYEREFTDAPVVESLPRCKNVVKKPDAGHQERWRRFKRGAGGTWEIVDFDPQWTNVY